MEPAPSRPFDSIENAHEFIALLEVSVADAIQDVRLHVQTATAENDDRAVQALTLALYKMGLLETHMQKSRRILNDLRTIRRLLFHERSPDGAVTDAS